MPEPDVWTIGRLLTWTTDFLKQHGSATPRLDAELLLAEAVGCPRIQLYASFGDAAAEPIRTAFRELVKRRSEGTPVAYLLGRREFYSLSFRVTPDVLIPRPETELVVVALLDRVKEKGSAGSAAIADVGTGSGILAVCAAKYLPAARVTALDISVPALAVARGNAKEHGVGERIEFVESDIFAALPENISFDFVVSNPPYIKEGEVASLDRDVRDHEPRLALVAGERGTEIVERLVSQSAERLKTGGWLIMEISPMIAADVERLVAASGKFDMKPITRDLAGHARVVQARRT